MGRVGAGVTLAELATGITTHGEGAKHRWTDEKLRKGAGAGANPDEIAIGTGAGEVAAGNHTHTLALTTVWDVVEKSDTTNDTDWHEVDSTTVTGTKKVIVTLQAKSNEAAYTSYIRVLRDAVQVAYASWKSLTGATDYGRMDSWAGDQGSGSFTVELKISPASNKLRYGITSLHTVGV